MSTRPKPPPYPKPPPRPPAEPPRPQPVTPSRRCRSRAGGPRHHLPVYTYDWPGVPTSPASKPPIVVPDHAPAIAEIPGDRLPDELPFAQYVYNVNSDKIGAAVLLGNDRKIDLYIVSVGDWFLDGSEKNIAIPSQ